MTSAAKPIATPTRRDVIATAGAGGVIAGIDALTGRSRAEARKPPHVVIVGAGVSGLCAAYLLQQRGWTYTILEAERNHVGGRVRTMPIGNGLHWEAGAMRIPHNHDITLRYINQFPEIKTRTFVMNNDNAYMFARGYKVRAKDEDKIRQHFDLSPWERGQSSGALWNLAVHDLPKGLTRDQQRELGTGDWFTYEKLRKWDGLSLRQLIEQARVPGIDPSKDAVPLSEEAIEYLLFGIGNLTLQHGASTEFLREEMNDVWDPPFSEIIGGTRGLPDAFARRLSNAPRMGCEVIRLEQDLSAKRAKAIYRQGGTEAAVEGDYLLCTLPFPVLSQIDVDPPFAPHKRRAIVEMGYDCATKVVFLTKSRFWELNDGIYGGSTTTDLITGPIFYPSDNADAKDPSVSNGPGVLLASYTWGQDARRLGAMSPSDRIAFTLGQVKKVHPELAQPGMILDKNTWTWDSYPWAGGAFAFYLPGQFARMHRHIVAPEAQIYFAGEHCSHSHSWMQGALESAEKAVDALLIAQAK